MTIFSLGESLSVLPLPATNKWPNGVFDQEVWRSRRASVSVFAPRSVDHQTPHDRDELYVIVAGEGRFDLDGTLMDFGAGDLIHVPAGVPHRFLPPLTLTAWVIFFEADPREKPTRSSAV